ncbi:hypothetical protein FACS1894110_17230 [Spirochaetia bacterium]|nr:hypothetical protein FACS1894110_17230 [Spirochaetia bacterium]
MGNTLISEILTLQPEHDYPAGLIHPYWARKPINILEHIITKYSQKNDVILDPFMGSGTTIIASLKNNRNVIGNDLNPLSFMLVKSILLIINQKTQFIDILEKMIDNWSNFSLSLYKCNNDMAVEREIYKVDGNFENGEFELVPLAVKLKPIVKNQLKGNIKIEKKVEYKNNLIEKYIDFPLDFKTIKFLENTRIAIHKDVNADQYFTIRNKIFINYAKEYIGKLKVDNSIKNVLNIFLSSMLPLLRLSDKKASSQWPYWRPKEELVSRNPIVALTKRKPAFLNLINWDVIFDKKYINDSKIFNISADKLDKAFENKVDLILTDPPYADQAPYLEYSDLFLSIITGKRPNKLYKKEIVETNAKGRENDTNEYENRLYNSFISFSKLLKNDKYLIFYYIDKNINHWKIIKKALLDSNIQVMDVISLPKQRRSIKNVISKEKSFYGDLLIISKKQDKIRLLVDITYKDIIHKIQIKDYFAKFGLFIKYFLMYNIVDLDKYDITDIMRTI